MSNKIYTAQEIVDILDSIEKVEIVNEELEISFKSGDARASVFTSFVPDSFTRELMELIYHHMTEDK